MKVYIVSSGCVFEDSVLHEAFSSLELATSFIEEQIKDITSSDFYPVHYSKVSEYMELWKDSIGEHWISIDLLDLDRACKVSDKY